MVHQYNLEVTPEQFWESDKVIRILRTKWKMIESTIGAFVPAGRHVLTLSEIGESVEWKFSFRGQQVEVKIAKDSQKSIYLNDSFKNKENDIK